MSSLKEIKERIGSVSSTRKITSAMKMVSAAKLHKAQAAIGGMLPYQRALETMTDELLKGGATVDSPLAAVRPVGHKTIVAIASNSTLCGVFNANIAKELGSVLKEEFDGGLTRDEVSVVAIGKKIAQAAAKMNVKVATTDPKATDRPEYGFSAELAEKLIRQFMEGETDRVEIIYHHFHSAGLQTVEHVTLLPIEFESDGDDQQSDYILEPSRQELLDSLIPQSIKLKLFTALLDSVASEHASRMIAMQAATDNADELVDELTVEYNKSRQQAITTSLLDMAGGQQEK